MATSPPFPTPYVPRALPTIPNGDNAWLKREIRSISDSIASIITMLPMIAMAAPDHPHQGMLRRAVSPWRPIAGQTDDAWVFFDGTQWNLLTS